MKKCKKCKIEKEVIEFNKHPKTKDRLRNNCKDCEKIYRISIREKTVVYLKEYYKNNKEELKQKEKKRYDSTKDVKNEKRKNKYNSDSLLREKISAAGKTYRQENKEKVSESKKKYYEENKDYVKMWKKNYYELIKNNDEYRNKRNKNTKKWCENNPHIVAWRNSLRRVLYYFNIKKCKKTIEMLGYSAEEFRENIQSKFTEGMSWENWGEWHIDHIMPVSKFDKETSASIVNALSNLQPLWAEENFKKSNN
jgi:hypothetical protein